MVPSVTKLSGERPEAQPKEGELIGEFRGRLAKEFGVGPNHIGILRGHAALPNPTSLDRLGDETLQVVVLSQEETMAGWCVRSLLNELCAGSESAVIKERLDVVEIFSPADLTNAIHVILVQALDEPQHSFTLASVVAALDVRWPELLPPPDKDADSGNGPTESTTPQGQDGPKTFKQELISALTEKFGSLKAPVKLDDTNGEEDVRARHQEQAFALMKFIGALFTKEVLHKDILGRVVWELIGRDDKPPSDYQAELVIELSHIVGPKLESIAGGRQMMSWILDRFVDIANWAESAGQTIFTQPILEKIEELLTLRRRNWGKPLACFA